MDNTKLLNNHRLSQAQKEADNFAYYRQQADLLDNYSFSNSTYSNFGNISSRRRKKVNYDLFNNILNVADLEYVCKPFGAEGGELPANMVNRDIISGKIKVLLGMEMKMPFSWKVFAVNEEATTRKEKEEFSRIKEFVISSIMKPIREEMERKAAEQAKGKELSKEEQEQIQAKIEEELAASTPEEVKKYMSREHQDPAEILAHQLLEYLIQKERIPEKFNKAFKHLMLTGEGVYHVGIVNGEPSLTAVNSMFFEFDKSPDIDYIEDGEWAVCEYRMTPSEIISKFGSELSNAQIDELYRYDYKNPSSSLQYEDFSFTDSVENTPYTLRVLHTTWKGLAKYGFLTYVDKRGEPQMTLVNDTYVLNKEQGDIEIEWIWLPRAEEAWKIGNDIYVHTRPVPGQNKDLDDPYKCKLPYYGCVLDNMNSPVTSPMDRAKYYQYLYNIIIYRIELLMASDKGKILAANINAIPKSSGLTTQKFLYFMEANKIAWFNPNEEGNRNGGGDVTNLVKEIDMSLTGQIADYIQLAETIEKKCGESIGVTKPMEGAIGPNEAVTNTKQNIIQSSHIIQPYFELHNNVKRNVLEALLETAKVAYAENQPKKLSYILDNMSFRLLTLDPVLLENSRYGLFVSNSSKAHDAKQAIESLAHAAMQTQQADLLDIMKVVKSENITEAEELLTVAKQNKMQEASNAEKIRAQSEERRLQMEADEKQKEREHEKEIIVLKEEERRKTEIQKQAMFSLGFDPNKDVDEDGTPDILEVAKHGVDAEIKRRKQKLDEDKFEEERETNREKLKLEQKKILLQANKSKSK